MKNLKLNFVLAVILLLSMQETTAQLKPENLVTAWEAMTKMVVETATAMPEEYYTYKPTEELRDFADQIAHTSGANYLFLS